MCRTRRGRNKSDGARQLLQARTGDSPALPLSPVEGPWPCMAGAGSCRRAVTASSPVLGTGTELQCRQLRPLTYDLWGWPGGWRPARSETLRFTLVVVLEGSALSEGLERDFFRPSSSPPAVSKRVDSNAARSSEPAFSLARSSMA